MLMIRFRNKFGMTEFPSLIRGGMGNFRKTRRPEVRRAGGQPSIIYRYLGKTVTKFIIDNSFASTHLCFFASNEEMLKQVQHDNCIYFSPLLVKERGRGEVLFHPLPYPSPERRKDLRY